jgi:hypothetical protein
MSNSHEPIYNQEDMSAVLATLQRVSKDAEQSKQLLWAVVDKVGGEIAIPYNAWLDNKPTKELAMWDDPATLQLHLKTLVYGDVDDEPHEFSTRGSG